VVDFSLQFDDLDSSENGEFTNLIITPSGTFTTDDITAATYLLDPDVPDNPSLSVTVVPEPTAGLLLFISSLALLARRRRRPSRSSDRSLLTHTSRGEGPNFRQATQLGD